MDVKETKTIGKGKPGPGRKTGVPNKATQNAREAIAMLVDRNTPRLQAWLEEIAQTDGALKAWQCMMDVIEYHIPKLSRAEHVGQDGGDIGMAMTITHVKPEVRD